MCFSAIASFTASAILGVAGIASVKKTAQLNQQLFAAIPLLFSVQQLFEGFVWMSLSGINDPFKKSLSIHAFLIFALIVWPLWISVSVILIEKNRLRKMIQILCLLCGAVFALFSSFYLISYNANAEVKNYHILYRLNFPNEHHPVTASIYFIATVIPLLVSGVKRVPLVGLLLFASYVTTKLLFNEYIISVWCFFAGIVSVIIYLMAGKLLTVFGKEITIAES